MPDAHPNPGQTDELAIRLFRAHRARLNGAVADAQSLDELQPGIAQAWRISALVAQDVLGVEGVAHAMAAMDNLAASTSNTDRIRANDVTIVSPMDAVRNVFEGEGRT